MPSLGPRFLRSQGKRPNETKSSKGVVPWQESAIPQSSERGYRSVASTRAGGHTKPSDAWKSKSSKFSWMPSWPRLNAQRTDEEAGSQKELKTEVRDFEKKAQKTEIHESETGPREKAEKHPLLTTDNHGSKCGKNTEDAAPATDLLLEGMYGVELTPDQVHLARAKFPEIPWLARCLARAPVRPGWYYDSAKKVFVCEATGEMSHTSPDMPHFVRLARLLAHARHTPHEVPTLCSWLERWRDDFCRGAAQCKTAWAGPFRDHTSGIEYYYCPDTRVSTWEDPCNRYLFLACVTGRLLDHIRPKGLQHEAEDSLSGSPIPAVSPSPLSKQLGAWPAPQCANRSVDAPLDKKGSEPIRQSQDPLAIDPFEKTLHHKHGTQDRLEPAVSPTLPLSKKLTAWPAPRNLNRSVDPSVGEKERALERPIAEASGKDLQHTRITQDPLGIEQDVEAVGRRVAENHSPELSAASDVESCGGTSVPCSVKLRFQEQNNSVQCALIDDAERLSKSFEHHHHSRAKLLEEASHDRGHCSVDMEESQIRKHECSVFSQTGANQNQDLSCRKSCKSRTSLTENSDAVPEMTATCGRASFLRYNASESNSSSPPVHQRQSPRFGRDLLHVEEDAPSNMSVLLSSAGEQKPSLRDEKNKKDKDRKSRRRDQDPEIATLDAEPSREDRRKHKHRKHRDHEQASALDVAPDRHERRGRKHRKHKHDHQEGWKDSASQQASDLDPSIESILFEHASSEQVDNPQDPQEDLRLSAAAMSLIADVLDEGVAKVLESSDIVPELNDDDVERLPATRDSASANLQQALRRSATNTSEVHIESDRDLSRGGANIFDGECEKEAPKPPELPRIESGMCHTAKFQPGATGIIEYRLADGLILSVKQGGVADKAGVKVGMRMVKVGALPYTHERLGAARVGNKSYQVTFSYQAEADAGHDTSGMEEKDIEPIQCSKVKPSQLPSPEGRKSVGVLSDVSDVVSPLTVKKLAGIPKQRQRSKVNSPSQQTGTDHSPNCQGVADAAQQVVETLPPESSIRQAEIRSCQQSTSSLAPLPSLRSLSNANSAKTLAGVGTDPQLGDPQAKSCLDNEQLELLAQAARAKASILTKGGESNSSSAPSLKLKESGSDAPLTPKSQKMAVEEHASSIKCRRSSADNSLRVPAVPWSRLLMVDKEKVELGCKTVNKAVFVKGKSGRPCNATHSSESRPVPLKSEGRNGSSKVLKPPASLAPLPPFRR